MQIRPCLNPTVRIITLLRTVYSGIFAAFNAQQVQNGVALREVFRKKPHLGRTQDSGTAGQEA
jgi:hypothetical protein